MKLKGYIYVFMSVLFFYSMTIFVKKITVSGNIPGIEVSFFRFLSGFIIVNIIKISQNRKIKVINHKALWARGILNTVAVILFFVAIQFTTTTKANIYNMTYPVFVAIFAPFFLAEKMSIKKLFAVILAFGGVLFVTGIEIGNFGIGDITGILGGLVGGFAIISLRKARLTDEAFSILYYLMTIGTVVSFISFIWFFKIPSMMELILLLIVGLLSFGGQYTLTRGYKYVNALEGSIISSARIFVAAIAGALFLHESLTLAISIGGAMLFASIVIISSSKE